MIQKTAIIIVTYGHWEQTKNCLDDLLKNPKESFRIFVVDNGSLDGTPERIAQDYPEVRLLCAKENRGFGAANNAGIALAQPKNFSFDSILFLNNDTRLSPNAIPSLQKDLSLFPNDVVVPRLLNVDGSLQKNWFSKIPPVQFFFNAFRSEESASRYVNGEIKPISGTSFYEAQWTNAAAWMMTRETWNKVGGFDENIFMYYEDVDWAYRAHRFQIRFLIDFKTSIIHLGGGSAKNVLSRSLQHDSSQLYFYRKHYGFKGVVLSRTFRAVRSSLRVLFSLPRVPFSADARNRVKLHFTLFLFALGLFPFSKK